MFLARDILIGRLQEICAKENVRCDGEVLETLIEGGFFFIHIELLGLTYVHLVFSSTIY